jgi:acyl carrier protein
MAMKVPVSGFMSKFVPGSGAAMGTPANSQTDCTTARHLLATTLGRSRSEIEDHQPLDDLIEDSLVREAVILDLEDFLGREIDRRQFCRAKTVSDLARLIAA